MWYTGAPAAYRYTQWWFPYAVSESADSNENENNSLCVQDVFEAESFATKHRKQNLSLGVILASKGGRVLCECACARVSSVCVCVCVLSLIHI